MTEAERKLYKLFLQGRNLKELLYVYQIPFDFFLNIHEKQKKLNSISPDPDYVKNRLFHISEVIDYQEEIIK